MEIAILLTIFFVKCLLAEMEEQSTNSSMVNELNHVHSENETLFADSNNKEEDPLLSIQFLPRPVESHSDGKSGRGKVIKHLLESGITSLNSSVPIGNSSSKLHRIIRNANRCKIPENLKESRLDCTLYPSRVECKQACIWGYTLKDGPKRTMKCKNSEGEWSPAKEFEKCKPYVDCGITLGPGGSYKCYTNYMDKPPKCEIACQKYEDKSAMSKKEYTCNMKGSWSPKLPFCAKAGSGVKTVPAPGKGSNHRHQEAEPDYYEDYKIYKEYKDYEEY